MLTVEDVSWFIKCTAAVMKTPTAEDVFWACAACRQLVRIYPENKSYCLKYCETCLFRELEGSLPLYKDGSTS